MKIKTLALAALAASMTFAACDNEDKGGSQPQDLMPKSVTITLPNIQKSTRATGDAMPGGSQVELTNFKVFFVNSANEAVTVPQFNGEDQKVFFNSEDDDWSTATGNKLTYHFLPATTTKVVVVGNIGDETYDNVKTKVCDVQNDADGAHPSYPLYGESGLTKGAAADDEGHNNVYTATVTLEPRVARFEIYGFAYTGTKYTSVELDKIALNHYYTKYNFVTKAPLEEDECFEDLTPTNAWDWIAGRTAPWADCADTDAQCRRKEVRGRHDDRRPGRGRRRGQGHHHLRSGPRCRRPEQPRAAAGPYRQEGRGRDAALPARPVHRICGRRIRIGQDLPGTLFLHGR